jgi:hypothetical protein
VLQGARLNQADTQGMTPLLLATSNVLWAGDTAVEALLCAGADPDQGNHAGATALCMAASLHAEDENQVSGWVGGCGGLFHRAFRRFTACRTSVVRLRFDNHCSAARIDGHMR